MLVGLFVPVGVFGQASAAAPTAAPVPVDVTIGGQATGSTYTVRAGDGFTGIARQMHVTIPALLAANHLQITAVIHPGQTLVVPAGGIVPTQNPPVQNAPAQNAPTQTAPAQTPPAAASGTYTVVAGDYLTSIARKSGVTLPALLTANKLIVTSLILPGRVLTLPPATLTIPSSTTTTPSPAATTPDTTGPSAPASPDTAPTTTAAPTSTAATPATTPTSDNLAPVIAYLQAQVGKGYAFNTTGPDTFDCSGLVTAAYSQISINLPHQSGLQSLKGTPVDWTKQP
ncbi:MAG: hypothetical protein JWN39_1383, partial [Ilumatobacteraceae bacterium]|nr:hypothetical protein [Ilumatobacteraceae bacterium]